jgi:WD40 repeat protein
MRHVRGGALKDEEGAQPVVERSGPGYDAFISYSHALDSPVAMRLQTELQRFAKPWNRRRSMRIFRDQASLSASPALWTSIANALDNSRFLVLLASPEAAASEWVSREVDRWREHKGPETVLIALTAGDIVWDEERGDFDEARTNALPDSASALFTSEPLHVDLRWARATQSLSRRDPRLLDSVASLAAVVHDRPKDEMIGEDLRQYRRTRRLARTALVTVVLLSIVAAASALVAVRQRDEARSQRREAQDQRATAESQREEAERQRGEAERQREEAERQREEAVRQRDLATSRYLATAASAELDTDPGQSLLLSVAALHLDDNPQTYGVLLEGVQATTELGAILSETAGNGLVESVNDDEAILLGVDGQLTRWSLDDNVETGRTAVTADDEQLVTSAVSGDGTTIATSDRDARAVIVRDADSIAELGRAPISPGVSADPSIKMTLNRDGTLLALRGEDELNVWDIALRKFVHRWPIPSDGRSVLDLTFSDDDRTLAVGGSVGSLTDSKGYMQLFDLASGELTREIETTSGGVRQLRMSPDGLLVASLEGGFGGRAALVFRDADDLEPRTDPADGDSEWTTSSRPDTLSFSEDGRFVATGGADGLIDVWSTDDLGIVSIGMRGDPQGVQSLSFSPDGSTLLSSGRGGRLMAWHPLSESPLRPYLSAPYSNGGFAPTLNRLAVAPGGHILAAAEVFGLATTWSFPSGTFLAEFSIDTADVTDLAFLDDEEVALVGNTGLSVFNATTGQLVRSEEFEFADDAALSPRGDQLAIARDGRATLRQLDGGDERPLSPPPCDLDRYGLDSELRFSPDGRTLLGLCLDALVMWDVASREITRVASLPGDAEGFVVSDDGQLVAGFGGQKVWLYVVNRDDVEAVPIQGLSGAIQGINLSSDASLIAVVGEHNTVALWDVGSGAQVQAQLATYGLSGDWHDVMFDADDEYLIAGNNGGWVVLWALSREMLIKRACAVANRDLSPAEWSDLVGEAIPFVGPC